MKSPVVKRSIVIAGHKTSVSLEDAFWRGLKEIAIGRDKTLSDLVAEIDTGRPHNNLSSAIRLFVLDHYRAQTNGHAAESKRCRDRGSLSQSPPAPAPGQPNRRTGPRQSRADQCGRPRLSLHSVRENQGRRRSAWTMPPGSSHR
jgi:predicted DNA-binding ribbon-helix-helix protein